jgi:hypothetical protein
MSIDAMLVRELITNVNIKVKIFQIIEFLHGPPYVHVIVHLVNARLNFCHCITKNSFTRIRVYIFEKINLR